MGLNGADPWLLLAAGWLLAGLWGLRLGGYLLRRVHSESEDGRYRALRAQWGKRTQPRMFAFFQVQAFWAVLFATPMLIAARNPEPLGWLDALAVGIWAVALCGEAYRAYQRTTNAFFPGPPRPDPEAST